jgi:hypothetical protein
VQVVQYVQFILYVGQGTPAQAIDTKIIGAALGCFYNIGIVETGHKELTVGNVA